MDPRLESMLRTRRDFLATSASGIGLLALASLLETEGLLASPLQRGDPLAPRPPHFAPRAERCIFLFMAGAPSHVDLFDPKPKLRELNGEPLPDSMTEKVRFAFIQKESAVLLGSPHRFRRYGECGMELSELLPHTGALADRIALVRSMHTEAFNHHPAQLMMNCGLPRFGLPSVGSWLNYGLGSECSNLPGYVVLSAGRGTSGGSSNWSSGFLPSTYEGVVFRNAGDPILNLSNPPGVTHADQSEGLQAIGALNRHHHERVGDEEIQSRIAAYELAFRMQSAAPELIDLSDEPRSIQEEYGLGRSEGSLRAYGQESKGQFHTFARNCLLARRLVERGVRFVNLYHATWDHHEAIDGGLRFNCTMADRPIAALLRDLERRGLLDSTLVVFAGEFGRTPLGENRVGRKPNTGRDHHPFAFSLWMAGGGIKGGQVIGRTDELGWGIDERAVHVNDFHATLLHLFGFDHERLTYRHLGRDFRLTDVAGKVVGELIA